GLCVEPLAIAPHELLDRTIHVHLDEADLVRAAHFVSDTTIRRDRGRDRRDAVTRQEPRDVTDAADVGVTVLFREAESLAQIRPDLVAVEHLDAAAAHAKRVPEPPGRRRLSAPPPTR